MCNTNFNYKGYDVEHFIEKIINKETFFQASYSCICNNEKILELEDILNEIDFHPNGLGFPINHLTEMGSRNNRIAFNL